MAALVALATGIAPAVASSAAYTPSHDELALLAYANRSRAEDGLTPYLWSDDLGRAARAHSVDMATNGCFQHDSCNGEAWWRRVGRYYPGYWALGENVGGAASPAQDHQGWMESPGHRANILGGYLEFGAGRAIDDSTDFRFVYSTEDFGSRTLTTLDTYPVLPSATVVPRLGFGYTVREVFVSYFDGAGRTPRAVRALIGSACVSLPRIAGSGGNAAYGTTRTFPSDGCTPVVFEAIDADGYRRRWPESGAIVVGTGWNSTSCPERTAAAPTQDCGGGGAPPPEATPSPAPTPGSTELGSLRVVLRPQRDAPTIGRVEVSAILPATSDFDPASGPVSIEVRFGQGGVWKRDLPRLCGAAPCLKANARGSAYNAKYDASTKLAFVGGAKGRWRIRFSAREETLGALDAGPVTVAVTVDGRTLGGSAVGRLRQSGLVAD